MAKKKGLSYEQKMINALNKVPNPLHDNRHNIDIYFVNDRARSNQSRFEHIINMKHGLKPSDIERIPRNIGKCVFKLDNERKESYNIYIRKNGQRGEYIKIAIKIDPAEPTIAIVKTIYITKLIK